MEFPRTDNASPLRASNLQERLGFIAVHCAVLSFLVALSYGVLAATPARAGVTFMGGDCTLTYTASSVRLDFCKNLTTKTVNDIHVTFSHPGLDDRLVDYKQCLLGIGDCFGPAVAPGANWEGAGGGAGDVANIGLWGPLSLGAVDFKIESVTASGYWTIDGKEVKVPEPSTWALMLCGFGLAGAALRSRRLRLRLTN